MEKSVQNKILIVDDVELIRDFLAAVLDLYDINPEFAANGKEAINVWEKEKFRAILMDLEMPVMGGLEAARIIRRREKEEHRNHTPIVAISGTDMENPHGECSKAGMDGFIPKPVEIRELLDVVLPLVS